MKRIAAIAVSLGLAVGALTMATATDADAQARNPWNRGTVKATKHMTVSQWQRYARSKHAHHIGRIDGHARCWGVYGPTTYVQCRDGYRTTS